MSSAVAQMWSLLLVKTFWRRFWFKSHMISRGRLVATCVRFLAVWKSNKRANREPTSCNHLGAFYWLVLLVRVRFLYPLQASRNVVHTLCFNVFMPPHVCARCLVFLWAQIRTIRCATYETVGHVFCQIFNHDISRWFTCKNWKSCSRQPSTISTIPCHWTLLRRRQQQAQWS